MKPVASPLVCLLALAVTVPTLGSDRRVSHEVVFLTREYRSFVEAARTAQDGSTTELYRAMIQDPLCSRYFQQCEYAALVRNHLETPIRDIAGLEQAIARVEAAEETIRHGVAAALAQLEQDFAPRGITFYILPSHPANRRVIESMRGLMGMTAGSTQILLTVEPAIPGWQAMLEYAVVHEFAHAWWTAEKFSASAPWTLLDYLVFEGRGDVLAQRYYPDIVAPWTQALTAEQKADLWEKINPDLGSEDFNHQIEVMFGSSEYPLWGGYTLGFDIVRTALRDSELSPKEWTVLDSRRILEMSGYGRR